MKHQIKSISIAQTSMVAAILYACMGILYFVIGIFMLLFGGLKFPGIMFLFMPIIMAVFGFLGVALFSWIYNIIASKVGGVEFELEELG